MTSWASLPFQVSRQTLIMLAAADAAEARENREQQERAEARREAAQADLMRYYQEHGEYPNDTLARQREIAARQEAAEAERQAQARVAKAEDQRTALTLDGHRPRTIAEVLRAAAGIAD
jgi:hypothetical protein